jgi:hypothetical protein
MQYQNITLNVLIKGKPITEYPHNGQVFVEGRHGSEFELEVRNNNCHRVEAIVSVDGISVTDGKSAGPQSSGYLIQANSSVRIPGWKLNGAEVASFEFAGKSDSYAGQATGDTRNTGVIGVMVFKEKVVAQPNYYGYGHINVGHSWPKGTTGSPLYGDFSGQCSMDTLGGGGGPAPKSMMASSGVLRSASVATSTISLNAVEQSLGTGFGQRQDFATTEVSFDRGDMLALIALYYDDKRSLQKRGIVMDRVSQKRKTQTPNAFPSMSGCVPPDGWKG